MTLEYKRKKLQKEYEESKKERRADFKEWQRKHAKKGTK